MAADSELNPVGRVSDVISVSQFPATVAAKNTGSIARAGEYKPAQVQKAIKELGLDPEKANPMRA